MESVVHQPKLEDRDSEVSVISLSPSLRGA